VEMCVVSGDGVKHASPKAEEIGIVTVLEVVAPSIMEVQGVVVSGQLRTK
jgi:hypothetical protein